MMVAVHPVQLTIPGRFNGPPDSANGGYTAGRLAAALRTLRPEQAADRPVTVTLSQPPPLDAAIVVGLDEAGRAAATFGGAQIATAEPGRFGHPPVDPVSPGTAKEAERAYAGLTSHPFPTCFSCGPQRSDGLGLRPGRVGADPAGPVACVWSPSTDLPHDDDGVAPELVWTALDCPSGWATDLENRPMVLGRFTVAVDARPQPGETCVVVARVISAEGRKAFTASTLYDSDGRVLGRAEATWIALR